MLEMATSSCPSPSKEFSLGKTNFDLYQTKGLKHFYSHVYHYVQGDWELCLGFYHVL